MSVRSVGGVDAPAASIPVAEAEAPPQAAEAKAVPGSQATRDGVDATRQAEQSALGAHRPPDEAAAADAVTLAEVLEELTGGELAADPNFQTLPPEVQEAMLSALADGPPGLAEIFKRLANSPAFRKLPAEVQARAVELLSKLAGDKADTQAVESMVRSPAFAALPEKEQLRMLDKLASSPEARADLQRQMEAPSQGGGGGISFGGGVETGTLLQVANMLEPMDAGLGQGFDDVPVDGDRGGQAIAAGDTAQTYSDIKRLVNQLRASPELSPSVVQAVLRMRLEPADASLPIFEGSAAKGPFHKAQLVQSPDPAGWLLVLEVRPRLDVPCDRFQGDLIPRSVEPDIDLSVPPDGEMTFRLADEKLQQDVFFAFGARKQRLRSVSIQRLD